MLSNTSKISLVCSLLTLIIRFGNLPISIIILKRLVNPAKGMCHLDIRSLQNKQVTVFIIIRIFFWVGAQLAFPSFILQFDYSLKKNKHLSQGTQSVTTLEHTNSLASVPVHTAQEKPGWKSELPLKDQPSQRFRRKFSHNTSRFIHAGWFA